MTDGASACLLMTRKMAKELNLRILGKFISHSSIGVPIDLMGIGPVYAIPKCLEIAGI